MAYRIFGQGIYLILGLAVMGGYDPVQRAVAEEGRPNILLILADDLGYGDLSSYGATDIETPNIDSLASNGIRLDNFYANCPVCSPTRAALLTGRYPDEVGVPGVIRAHNPSNSWGYWVPEATSLATVLSEANYRTACVGKWHLGTEMENLPNERGFDYFHGFLGDMMDDYYSHRRAGINYMRHNREKIDPEGHATTLFTNWATDYIAEQADSERPFFLYLAYNAPHSPIQPPPEWLKRVKAREAGIRPKRAQLAALIEHMDHGIGLVIDALKASQQYRNTLVLFTSDNGGSLHHGADNGDLRAGKQSMYEGGLRVPMCAVWPGHIQAGSSSDTLGMTMDLFATACDVADHPIPSEVDGVSLLPSLLGKRQPELAERTLFWMRREGHRYQGQDYYAVRKGPWKLLQDHPFERYKLYNLRSDPKEQNNLAEERRQKRDELAALIRRQLQQAGEVPWQKP